MEAAAAAASLVAALRLDTQAADGGLLEPAVYAAISVSMATGVVCCSSNLLPPRAAASSLHGAAASLAGAVMAQRKAKLLQCGLLPRWGRSCRSVCWLLLGCTVTCAGAQEPLPTHIPARRHRLEDVLPITALSASATAVCVPLLARRREGSAEVLGALTLAYYTPPTSMTLRRALLMAHTLTHQHEPHLRGYLQLVTGMLLPQRLHVSNPSGAGAGDSDSGSESDSEGSELYWRDWELSSRQSGSSDDGARSRSSEGPVVPQRPLVMTFREPDVERQFAR